MDQGSFEGGMGLSLVFRPLLLSIIHFEKDTSERNGNTQRAKTDRRLVGLEQQSGVERQNLNAPWLFAARKPKTHPTICTGFVENLSPQANKCKLSSRVGTAQCFRT